MRSFFFADLIGSRGLEYGFIATPSPADLRQDPFPLMPAELDGARKRVDGEPPRRCDEPGAHWAGEEQTAYFATADLHRLSYAYY